MALANDPPATLAARPAASRLLLVMAGALLAGLVLNQLGQHHLAFLEAWAASDPIGARHRLAWEIRIGGLGIFTTIFALGCAFVATAMRALRTDRFPPPGVFSIGTVRVVTGPAARFAAAVVVVLAVLLMACAGLGGWLSWEMGARLIACRAGVPVVTP